MKMFLFQTLVNLVIYVRNVRSKNTEAPFPIYLFIYLQWSVILDKCTEISSKYRRSALFFNALSFCFDVSSFQTTHRNKNKLLSKEQIEAEAVKKLRTMSFCKIY